MKKLAIVLTVLLSGAACASAEPVVKCDGETYEYCRSIGNPSVWLNDVNDITTEKDGYMYVDDGCDSILPGVPNQHRKCVLSGAEVTGVIEMSQAEKDALVAAQVVANTLAIRTQAETTVDAFNDQGVVFRSSLLAILDQINALRADIQAMSEASSEIPDVTRNAFTPLQMKTAIKNKIQAGDAD